MPTRAGRHGLVYSRFGRINLRNAKHADDPRPIDPDAPCEAARIYSRAYLHHLVKAGEILAMMLLTTINLAYYETLMAEVRAAIAALGAMRTSVRKRKPSGHAASWRAPHKAKGEAGSRALLRLSAPSPKTLSRLFPFRDSVSPRRRCERGSSHDLDYVPVQENSNALNWTVGVCSSRVTHCHAAMRHPALKKGIKILFLFSPFR